MSIASTPWWMMKDSPDDWDFKPLFSTTLAIEYAVQPPFEKNPSTAGPRSSLEETKAMACWLQKRRAFRRETYSMISMLDRLQAQREAVPIDWINILCVEKDSDDCVFVHNDDSDCGVSIKIECNPDSFFEMAELEKSKWVIDVVEKACRKLSVCTDIELPEILDACEQVRHLRYRNKWVWGEKLSPNKASLARVTVAQDTCKTRIAFEVYNANGIPLQSTRIEDSPYLPDIWRRYLNDLEWVSNESVRLHMRETFLELNLENDRVE